MGFKIIAAILTLSAHTLIYGQNIEMKSIKIIAHRGASFYAPENTLASFKLGWHQNADACELDIHLSADKKIVVIHDDNTKRTTGEDCKIEDTLSEKLREMDTGTWKSADFKGERIPFLKEVLAIIPVDKKLIIEIKTTNHEIIPLLKEEIENSGKKLQCEIISFDFEMLAGAKKAMPHIPAYFLMNKLTPVTLSGMLPQLRESHIDGLNLNFATITWEIAELCRKNKIPLYSWTIDDPEVAKRLIDLGVTGITTNKPLEMREQLLNP